MLNTQKVAILTWLGKGYLKVLINRWNFPPRSECLDVLQISIWVETYFV
jgi:hypothetical protein